MTIENYKGLRFDGRLFDMANQEIDYRGLLKKYFLSKWYVYVLFLLLFAGLSYFYVSTIEPTYEIKSKLLITQGERDNGSPEDWLKRSLNFSAIPDNVYNEIQVLTSYALVNQVVNYLNLDIEYFWEEGMSRRTGYRDFPISVNSYNLNSGAYYNQPFMITPVDRNSFRLSLEGQEIGTYQYDQEFSNGFGTFCFELNGNPNLYPESSMHVQFFYPAAVTEAYVRKLNVGFIDVKSTTLEIILEDAVPQRGVEILNNLIIRYHQIKNQENNRVANNTLQFIDERLVDIGRDLRSIESSVESYKLSNNITAESTSDLQIVLETTNKLNSEREDLDVQLNVLESMKRNLNMSNDEFDLLPTNRSTSNLRIDEVVKSYNDQVLERRRLLVTSQPTHPIVLSATQKLISLRNTIYSAIENLQNDMRMQATNVKTQYERSVAQLRSVPTKERQLMDKSRQQAIVENLYTYLLQKREETALSLIGTAANSIVIDPPRSTTSAVAPNKLKFYFAGSFMGLALPFLLISVVEVLRDSIQSEEQLKTLVPNHSIIGLINRRGAKGKQVVMQKSRSLISDRFRSLRTNVQFLAGDDKKCVMVTSSASKEGKTFIATNLAASFALKEERTIIVDFDLRNPQVANYLEEHDKKNIGLSNFFLDEISNIREIIHPSKIANLDYITGGVMPDYPDELILKEKKLIELFDYLKLKYNTIILDTSPVGIISDAILLNKYVSHTLYVVRVGTTKKDMVEKARELFDQDQLVNPFLVLNGVKKGEVYGYKVK